MYRINLFFTLTVFAITIFTKGSSQPVSDTSKPVQANKVSTSGFLLVINGKVWGPMRSLPDIDNLVPVQSIDRVNILRDSIAIAKYGPTAKRGVIEIYLKDTASISIIEARLNEIKRDAESIFEKVETAPSFLGGAFAWREFLSKNIKGIVPIDKGAPPGTYKVLIKFIVSKEGKLDNFSPMTSNGYGMEEECIRVLKVSPDWLPGEQNGRDVNAWHEQSFTFVITDEGPKKKNKNLNEK